MLSLDSSAVIITGASSGLGAEFARQLAPRAARLLLVARRREPMQELRAELERRWPALQVLICPADLATEAGRGELVAFVKTQGFAPNVLINNAGLGDYGAFTEADEERLRQQLEVNIGAVVYLTHALLPLLARPGGILNVSSLASTLPMPDLAVYAASKAFVTSFSEALTVELAGQGLQVSCVCPGPTPTSFGSNAKRAHGADTNRDGQEWLKMPPEKVVQQGLQALETGRTCVFPGRVVALAASLFRCLPRPILRWLLRRRFQST
jgi:short-subunit dehydrogenase